MRLAERLTALRAWCKQNVRMVVENPTCSLRHYRDARVYAHLTTAKHDNELAHCPQGLRNLVTLLGRVASWLNLSAGSYCSCVAKELN